VNRIFIDELKIYDDVV